LGFWRPQTKIQKVPSEHGQTSNQFADTTIAKSHFEQSHFEQSHFEQSHFEQSNSGQILASPDKPHALRASSEIHGRQILASGTSGT
jgi:hypothetical protein